MPASLSPAPAVAATADLHLSFIKALIAGDRRTISALTLGRRLDFDDLAQFLVDERMGVYVHARLAELSLAALLPRRVAEPIRWQYEAQQQRIVRLLALLGEVRQMLAAADIEFLVLKGLPLGQRFWGGLERRFSLDLDLFVRRDRFADAVAAVARIGFKGPEFPLGAERLALRLSHALELTRDDLSLDLHWTLRNRPGLRFDLDALWNTAGDCQLKGITTRIPSNADQLVMLLTGLANDLERGHHRLRSFWDIYFMLKGMEGTDWVALCAQRADQGLARLLPNLLAVVLQRLDCWSEFPALSAYLAGDGSVVESEPQALDQLLSNRPQSLDNRRWFADLLPVPRWRYWLWWGGTLPLRYWLGRHI